MRYIVKPVRKVDGSYVPQAPFVVDADDVSAAQAAAVTRIQTGGGTVVGWVDARLPIPTLLVLEVA